MGAVGAMAIVDPTDQRLSFALEPMPARELRLEKNEFVCSLPRGKLNMRCLRYTLSGKGMTGSNVLKRTYVPVGYRLFVSALYFLP